MRRNRFTDEQMVAILREAGVHFGRRVKSRQPTIVTQRDSVDAGGLMSHGPNFPELYRKEGTYVAKILKSADLADLPTEQPTAFEQVIRLKIARALGITIPQSVLLRTASAELRPSPIA